MRKGTANYILDFLSLVAMLAIAATGLLMKYVLPPGSSGQSVWGLGRHDWGGIHFWLAAALILLVVVHLALHWVWVCASTRGIALRRPPRARTRGRRDTALGFILLACTTLVLAGFVAAARASIVGTAGGERRGAEHGPDTSRVVAPGMAPDR
ncbi:MAG: DUF4405 domain-containing protein [Gemmatimonadota bacterium]|jgi:hypothetical protein